MKTDPGKLDPARLCQAIRSSRLALRRFREERVEAVRQYVGRHWSDEGTSATVPVNLISLYVNVVGRNLLAKNPRCMLSTFNRQMKPMVNAMETWANQRIEDMHLASTLQRVVTDGLFSIGIVKVAIASLEDSASVAWRMDAGTPMVSRIDLDDFVFDIHARSFEEVGYIGHRYRVPLEVARFDKRFNRDRRDLSPVPDAIFNMEGDERINVLGRSMYDANYEEFEPYVSLWEIYMPRHKAVFTLTDDYLTGANLGKSGDPLCVQKWVGPDNGPIHTLGFSCVPGNAMPKAPIQDLIDLHGSVNNLYRKSIRQGQNEKELLLTGMGAMEDAERVQEASDGEIVQCNNPDAMRAMPFRGVNPGNLQFGMHLKDLFGWLAGNLDMMGGLSPQSKTLGQDQMLAQNASRSVADMQDATVTFTASVLKSLCWFWYHHPTHVMRTEYPIPGLPGESIPRMVTPQQRMQGTFEELHIRVDPYSIVHKTPESRWQNIMGVVTGIYLPMVQAAQAQGVNLDLNKLFEIAGKYLDEPDIMAILSVMSPPQSDSPQQPGGAPQQAAAGKPAETTRNYVRRSIGQDTGANRESDLMNSLAGEANFNTNGKAH